MAKPDYTKKKTSSFTDFSEVLYKIKKSENHTDSLRSILDKNKIRPLLALEYKSSLILRQTLKTLEHSLKKLIPTLEVIRISGESLNSEKNVDELCVNLCSQTFFATDTLYIISENKKLKDKSLDKILAASERSENAWSIMTLENIPQNKTWKEAFPTSSTFSVHNPTGEILRKWVQKEVKETGISSIEEDAITYLIEELESSPEKIYQTLEKASLLIPLHSVLSLDLLTQVLQKGMHKDVFDLFNAIAKKDRLLTSLILDRVLNEGSHPLQIVALISKSLRSIAGALSKTKEVSADISNPWMLKKLPMNAFPPERVINGLRILSELDSGLKGRNFSEEEFLYSKLLSI